MLMVVFRSVWKAQEREYGVCERENSEYALTETKSKPTT